MRVRAGGHRRAIRVGIGACVAAVIGLVPIASASVGAAMTPAPTWKLVDLHDRRCDQLGGGGSPGAYAVEISGRWTHALTVGADTLPAGVTATALQSPIPPGSSNGQQELAYVSIGVARRQAVPGTYSLGLWADDGSSHQRVVVTLVIQTTRCVAY